MATGGTEPQPLNEREMAAWRALLRAHSTVVRRLAAELESETGLSLPAYEVLVNLSEAPGERLRMSELAVRAVLTPSGMTRVVDRLCCDGLVRRDRCAPDGRVVYAVLTSAGRRRLERAYPVHLRGVREHFIDRFSADELATLADALGGFDGDAPPCPDPNC